MSRERIVSARLSEDEFWYVSTKAANNGLNVSDYLRNLLLSERNNFSLSFFTDDQSATINTGSPTTSVTFSTYTIPSAA